MEVTGKPGEPTGDGAPNDGLGILACIIARKLAGDRSVHGSNVTDPAGQAQEPGPAALSAVEASSSNSD